MSDDPIDRIDDIRRTIRRKVDSITDAAKTLRERRDLSDADAAKALDQLRERELELAALLQRLIFATDAAEVDENLKDVTGRERHDDLEPVEPDTELRDELAGVHRALGDILEGIDGDRPVKDRVLPEVDEDIESWAQQRRGDTPPEDRVDLDGVDAPTPPPPKPDE